MQGKGLSIRSQSLALQARISSYGKLRHWLASLVGHLNVQTSNGIRVFNILNMGHPCRVASMIVLFRIVCLLNALARVHNH